MEAADTIIVNLASLAALKTLGKVNDKGQIVAPMIACKKIH